MPRCLHQSVSQVKPEDAFLGCLQKEGITLAIDLTFHANFGLYSLSWPGYWSEELFLLGSGISVHWCRCFPSILPPTVLSTRSSTMSGSCSHRRGNHTFHSTFQELVERAVSRTVNGLAAERDEFRLRLHGDGDTACPSSSSTFAECRSVKANQRVPCWLGVGKRPSGGLPQNRHPVFA